MPIKLVTFDLDNTLWDVDPIIVKAEHASYDWLKQHCPQATSFYTLEAISEYRAQIAACYPDLGFRVSKLREEVLRRVIMQSGIEREEASRLAKIAFDVFYKVRNEIPLFNETIPVLQTLKQHYTLMAITNGNASLELTGLSEFFSTHFSAEIFGEPKPEAGMFLAALQKANALTSESVHVGDHPEQDIYAAHTVGMHTIWVNLKQAEWPRADITPSRVITSLSELPIAIASLH